MDDKELRELLTAEAVATVTRASDESLHPRLTLAHERITQLRKENQQLREALAHACGRLRAAGAPTR